MKMEFPSQVVSKKYSTLFSAKFGPFRTRSGAMCRPCTINVRNEPVQEMFCVVKCETPPVLRWNLFEFQDGKSISILGINLIVWRGWLREVGSSKIDPPWPEVRVPWTRTFWMSILAILSYLIVKKWTYPGSYIQQMPEIYPKLNCQNFNGTLV